MRRIAISAGDVRATAVAMSAVLASFFSAWLIEDLAGLHTNVVILATVLALITGRPGRNDGASGRDAVVRIASVALLSVVASGVGTLMVEHVTLGDTLFAIAMTAGIWLRRFGRLARRAGTLLTLPFVAILVTPAPPGFGASGSLWTAVIAAMAVTWVTVAQLLARRSGFLTTRTPVTFVPPPRKAPAGRLAGLPASTKMATQMGIGLGLAFVVGHQLFPQHWPWVVLTAYIVASGNRGRGDVLYKSGQRLLGAGVGTIAATLLSNTFAVGDRWAVVAIFVVVAVATLLRTASYAYWAAGVTAALAFLYGYSGQTGTSLLGTRLEAIACGAVLAVAAAWFVMPIKTRQVLRRRVADGLAVLGDYLTATRRRDLDAVAREQERFEAALEQVEQLRPTLAAHHVFTKSFGGDVHSVQAIDGLRMFREPTRQITERASSEPDYLAGVAPDLRSLHTALNATRRRIGRLPITEVPEPPAVDTELPSAVELHAALGRISAALT